MGYIECKNQQGVGSGYTKYRFDLRLNGKRERKLITCRKSAVKSLYREWENQIYSDITGNYSLFEKLDEYLKYSKDFKSEGTYLHEKTVIEDAMKVFFKKDMKINDFRRSHAEDFIQWRKHHVITKYGNVRKKEKLSNATVNRTIAVASCFFNYCIRKEYCIHNPFSMTKLKENNYREVNLSEEQINELLKKSYDIDSMLYNVITIALFTGMRRGEIFSLEWTEVDFDNSVIRLSHLKTKSKKRRFVPISDYLKDVLLSIKNIHYDEKYVIADYTIDILKKQWDKLLVQIDFGTISNGTKLHFHDLRHVFSQTLLNSGVQLEDIQFLLGHQSFETTQKRYAMFARPDLNEKAGRMDNVIRFKAV